MAAATRLSPRAGRRTADARSDVSRLGSDHSSPSTTPEFVFLAAGRSGGHSAQPALPGRPVPDNLLVTRQPARRRSPLRRAAAAVPGQLVLLSAAMPRSRWRSSRSGPGRWSRPARPTPPPSWPASRCAAPIASSTAATFIVGIPANVVRPGRRLRSAAGPRHPGADGPDARGRMARRAGLSRSGARARPVREFLYADDLADACLFVMRHARDGDADQSGRRREPVDRRAGRARFAASSAIAGGWSSTRRSPTACR